MEEILIGSHSPPSGRQFGPRDGFEKSFRDTASSLETLKASHELTRKALKSKDAELTESQNALAETRKALTATRKSLKSSGEEVTKQSQIINSLKESCETLKKNCGKLKDSFAKAKETALAANNTLIKVVDMCVPERGTARPLGDRLATFTEDLRAQTRTKVKVLLSRALVTWKRSHPDISLTALASTATEEPSVSEYADEAHIVAESLVNDMN